MQSSINHINTKLERSLKRANRAPQSCQLIAVSKTQSTARIETARAHGLQHFGENKVQEARGKFSIPQDRQSDEHLHLIGPLQTNKVRQAVTHFDFIHSVDRPKLVDAIARICAEENRWPKLFIQVNTGEETQKAGVLPANLAALITQARAHNLPLIGLMCIPPSDQAPAPHFAWLADQARQFELPDLSMGMSDDFEAAAELGATYVRVGSAIFGARETPTGL